MQLEIVVKRKQHREHAASRTEAEAFGPRRQQGSRNSPIVCWKCGQQGHVQRNCERSPVEPDRKLSGTVSKGSHGLDKANVYLRMQLAGRMLPCLLDSGCEVTLMPETVVEAARDTEVLPSNQRLWAANGTEIEILGEVTVPLLLDGRCIMTTALVSADIEEVMLNFGWLQKHTCLWDFGRERLFIDGRAAVTLTRTRRMCCRRVFVQEELVFPPRQEVNVTARSTLLSPRKVGADLIIDGHRLRPGLYVGRTLLPSSHRDLKVRMVNTTAEFQVLTKDMCLGSLQPVDVIEDTAPRAVNEATYKDSYSLPHIDTCLGSINGAVWFTTLDLRSEYHAIPIKEADRDKTAFITRRGC